MGWCGCWETARSTSMRAFRQNVTKHRRPVRFDKILSEVWPHNKPVYLAPTPESISEKNCIFNSSSGFRYFIIKYYNIRFNKSLIFYVAGKFKDFVDVISARTAVGHDAEGKLILFHVDGQTRIRGWERTLNLSWCQLFITVNIDLFPLSVHATTQTNPEWCIDQ